MAVVTKKNIPKVVPKSDQRNLLKLHVIIMGLSVGGGYCAFLLQIY